MIQNKQYRIKKAELAEAGSLLAAIEKYASSHTLRWYIAQATEDELVVEASMYEEALNQHLMRAEARYYPGRSVLLNVIPTGVGCSIGGYAGDAAPATNLLASTVDYLVTNPNAVNASDFISMAPNLLYTEGHSIDLFCKGLTDLHIPYGNKVGLIVEKAEDWQLNQVFNIVNTARSVYGVEIVDVVVTDRPIGSRCERNRTGAFVGTIDHPEVIFEACERLVQRGATAIAITTTVQDLPLDDYARHFAGEDSNPVGGVEAIISHLITNQFQLPAAHAPMINVKQLELDEPVVDARGAGEFSSISGLACVLIGLRRAPQIAANPHTRIADTVNVNNLLAVVLPAGCLGGAPALYAQKHRIPIIAVRENQTILNVTQQQLELDNVIEVYNYAEAAGVVMALKHGISLQSIVRPLDTLRYAADRVGECVLQAEYEEALVV